MQLTSELIQIDSSNTGELETTTGEAEAAAYVDAKLREVGYETEIVESGAPGRHNVFCRLPGADSSRPALLVHGHLDVVPFTAEDWSVHPLSGAVQDGYVWGRGAVDMKDMDAMILALARQFRAEGVVPPATWSSRSSPTRRPAARTARTGWPSTVRTSSPGAPRPSARSAGSR